MTFLLNFDDIKGATVLPQGKYLGVITKVNKTVKEKDQSIGISFDINIDGTTYKSKMYQVVGKGKFFLKQALINLGVKIGSGEPVDLDDLALVGVRAEWKVQSRDVNGTEYTDIVPVKSIGRVTNAELVLLA